MSPVTAAAQVTSFAHTFLLTDGVKPKLEVSDPSEALRRKKRAHRKSRNGCVSVRQVYFCNIGNLLIFHGKYEDAA